MDGFCLQGEHVLTLFVCKGGWKFHTCQLASSAPDNKKGWQGV